jgi:uncharacterized FlaG/YvyC family protein
MSENPINTVNRVETQIVQSTQVHAAQVKAQYKKEPPPAKPVETPAKDTAPKKEEIQASIKASSRQTNLEFRVDPDKNEVMVIVVDKATKKVVATIPPEAIKDIPPGDLIEYSA